MGRIVYWIPGIQFPSLSKATAVNTVQVRTDDHRTEFFLIRCRNAAAFQQESRDWSVSSGFRGAQMFHDLLHQSRNILTEYRQSGRELSAQ